MTYNRKRTCNLIIWNNKTNKKKPLHKIVSQFDKEHTITLLRNMADLLSNDFEYIEFEYDKIEIIKKYRKGIKLTQEGLDNFYKINKKMKNKMQKR